MKVVFIIAIIAASIAAFVVVMNRIALEKYYYYLQLTGKMSQGNTSLACSILSVDQRDGVFPLTIEITNPPNKLLHWTPIGSKYLVEVLVEDEGAVKYFLCGDGEIRLIAAHFIG